MTNSLESTTHPPPSTHGKCVRGTFSLPFGSVFTRPYPANPPCEELLSRWVIKLKCLRGKGHIARAKTRSSRVFCADVEDTISKKQFLEGWQAQICCTDRDLNDHVFARESPLSSQNLLTYTERISPFTTCTVLAATSPGSISPSAGLQQYSRSSIQKIIQMAHTPRDWCSM